MDTCFCILLSGKELRSFLVANPNLDVPTCGRPAVAIMVVKEGREYEPVCQVCMDRIKARQIADEDDMPFRFILKGMHKEKKNA